MNPAHTINRPAWPAHDAVVRPWRQRQRGGTRADRIFAEVVAYVPPTIADLPVAAPPELVLLGEEALVAAARSDARGRGRSAALGRFMVRSESVASSKIERITPDSVALARALAGQGKSAPARSVVAAMEAIHGLLLRAGSSGRITRDDVLDAHAALMREDSDPGDRAWAGRFRAEQNWLGGSDHSPRDAVFVPPPPDLVPDLMSDLIRFANRDDVPVLIQAAIVHAQFESIHPFTDGNGRIGRALIGALLQRRGVTLHATLPVACALGAMRPRYFEALAAYRRGEIDALVRILGVAITVAADEAGVSFLRLWALPGRWRRVLGVPAESAEDRILEFLHDRTTLMLSDLVTHTGAPADTLAGVTDALETAGILREVTGRLRERIWVVADVVDELDDLERRIHARLASGAAAVPTPSGV
ncbi:Fic family protein [Mycetocola sp. JXN-3]|uniref:Fic family protein n=1 Tax=Mycetocola sp. JXN-3 TaxID=2116510 RepID=UPI00165D11F1|nr:Fic family protein [Mycetocola sp. JXN-3]